MIGGIRFYRRSLVKLLAVERADLAASKSAVLRPPSPGRLAIAQPYAGLRAGVH